jgi:hypothetical protein
VCKTWRFGLGPGSTSCTVRLILTNYDNRYGIAVSVCLHVAINQIEDFADIS